MWFQSTICAPERDTKARCAAWFRVALSQPRVVWALVLLNVIPVNVVLPGAAARVASTSASHASTRLFIKALAQHALAADAASRRARSCVFQRQYLLQCGCHQLVAAPLKRNPLGRCPSTSSFTLNCFSGKLYPSHRTSTKAVQLCTFIVRLA